MSAVVLWSARLTIGLALALPLAVAGAAEVEKSEDVADISAEQRHFFEAKIRPVLVSHCYACHSVGADEVGGKLLLDSREGIVIGGESGPAIDLESPGQSLIMEAIRYAGPEMPPDQPLGEAIVADFATWIGWGAPDPRSSSAEAVLAARSGGESTDEAHWAFQPLVDPPRTPSSENGGWARDSIDDLVWQRMLADGLNPTHDAPPEVLIRRLSYDLIGLPASRLTTEAFVEDYRKRGQLAVRAAVDDLLASPHFGERWGRHWLDVARFGESNGNDGLSRNPTFPHAWRYRDYVIDALNDDVPYDRFITEQIAGDLLTAESAAESDRLRIATGFLAIGSKPAKAMNVNFDMDVVADQIDVVSTAIMGLSVACARCHDHKHDPIPTNDYYALAGIFLSTETLWGLAANEKLTAPATPLHELTSVRPRPVATSGDDDSGERPVALAMGVRDRKKIVNCQININGESQKLGPEVARGMLSLVDVVAAPAVGENQSGRVELARWLTDQKHPLTARVMVNRVWWHLFGQAIVPTPDDFGSYGAPPTHPGLLDHLAVGFQQDGWSLKRLIRRIVLSRTYQLASEAGADAIRRDPDNRLLSRHLRRRLDAEALRDSMLVVSGQFDARPGEGSVVERLDVLVNKQGSLHRPSRHRSVYLCSLRNSPPPELAAFDFPDGIRPLGMRPQTTLPSQSLFLLNSPFVIEQSLRFAERLLADPKAGRLTSDPESLIERAFVEALGRAPTTDERAETLELVAALVDEPLGGDPSSSDSDDWEARRRAAWAAVCQALMATNEFRYLD